MDDVSKREEILSAFPKASAEALTAELQDEERLIWVAQPSAKSLVRYASSYFIFGIPVLALFMVLFVAALVKDMMLLSVLPVPMVFVGISISLAPLRLAQQGKKVIYALTSDRLILYLGNRGGGVKTIGLHQIVSIRRTQADAPVADLLIQTEYESKESSTHLPFPVRFPDSALIGIENPQDVHLMIEKQIHTSR
ncbi:MAG: hypothetical protein HN370_05450 [Phycisphaerales bacterium]|jgi:hypothetical protein|nr:hypothetical protein [Phycisphaerales bacterium]